MTTNLHYLIAGMAVLLVVLWQYSHQRQMDDRNSLMFRRLLTVVSLDVLAELVSTCFILYAPYSFGVGRMLSNTVFYLFQAILPLMLLYYVCTLCSSRVISTGTVLRVRGRRRKRIVLPHRRKRVRPHPSRAKGKFGAAAPAVQRDCRAVQPHLCAARPHHDDLRLQPPVRRGRKIAQHQRMEGGGGRLFEEK